MSYERDVAVVCISYNASDREKKLIEQRIKLINEGEYDIAFIDIDTKKWVYNNTQANLLIWSVVFDKLDELQDYNYKFVLVSEFEESSFDALYLRDANDRFIDHYPVLNIFNMETILTVKR